MPSKFVRCYAKYIDFSYEIFDRIVFNGYVQKLQRENQTVYFLRDLRGVKCISTEALKRLTSGFIQRVEEYVEERGIPVLSAQRGESKLEAAQRNDKRGDKSDEGSSGEGEEKNRGKLIVDTSCAPADIRYSTDLNLLNEAREKSEGIIDRLHEPLRGLEKKVRTYRQRARRDFLRAAKKRKLSVKALQRAIAKQLRYVKRDLEHIEKLRKRSSLSLLSRKEYRDLLVIGEVYRQQKTMHGAGTKRIEGRIVSISQPHVRSYCEGESIGADGVWGEDIGESGGRLCVCGADELGELQ